MGIFREENQILNLGALGKQKKMIFPVCFSQIFCVCTSIFFKRTSR